MKKIFVFVLSIVLLSFSLTAQEALKSLEEDYYDYLSLIGIIERPTLGYRTLSDSQWTLTLDDEVQFCHPWENNNLGKTYTFFNLKNSKSNFFLNGINKSVNVKFYGPEFYNSYNTVNPYGQNDGGMWQGAGYNMALTGGIRIEAFGFEATIKPQLSFSQNIDFHYMPGAFESPYSYYWGYSKSGGIDLVQRYGDSAFFNFDWGDTEIRYTFYNFTLGFGTENPWIGPAYLNPMLGSNNAGGYPKFDIGFRKTDLYLPWWDLSLGYLEARAFVGKLSESKYFDYDSTNDSRMLNALFVSYSPSFIPGFTVGANRVILTKWKSENLKYFGRLFTFSKGNDISGDGEDQKISLFFDFLFPQVGFEVYGEYGMDDFTSNIFANPFHTGIYTLGFKQNIPLWKSASSKNIRSELIVELNNFEMSQDFQLQWPYGGYYYHHQIGQGYTQNGQILGAGSGYFGNSQIIKYTVSYPKGKTSFFVQRNCPNINYIYNKAVNDVAPNIMNQHYGIYLTYFDFGLETSYFVIPSLILSGGIVYDIIYDIDYILNNTIWNNFQFKFNIKYNF